MQHAFREFARYASLNALGTLGFSCYILADTFFIAQGLGADGLTALNLAIPIYSLVHGSGLMLGMGGATRYSICRGQRDDTGASASFVCALYPAAILALIYITAGLFFPAAISAALGADAQVLTMTTTYLKVILLFSPAFLLNDITLCFVRNDGSPRLSMFAMLASSFSNIILDYVFIFPCQMGIFGAVLATALAPCISLIVLSFHWKHAKFGLRRRVFAHSVLGRVLSLGLPSLVTELSSGIVIMVFNFIILGLCGNTGVAAYGVIANLSLVVISLFTGISQGVQPLLSRAYGRGALADIRQLMRYLLTTVLALAILIYCILVACDTPVIGAFNSAHDAALQSIAEGGLRLYFLAIPFAGCNIALSFFFTSTGRALPAHCISLLRGLVLIVPMAFVLSALLQLTGVWLAFPVTEILVTVCGTVLYIHGTRKQVCENR